MKIAFTGAGGGHFYPLIAVAERIRKEVFTQKIVQPDLYFFSDQPYNETLLFESQIKFVYIPAGKLRVYPSFQTFLDIFKTIAGCFFAIIKLYSIYPDVVFAKGGYASFPTLFAARILAIPVVVHESDTVPGRTTKWAGGFAKKVAIAYPEAASFYPRDRTALIGQPIRDIIIPPSNYVRNPPAKDRNVIMIIGGSQGSKAINESILLVLPELLSVYDIVHQVGVANKEDMKKITDSILKNHPYKDHYFMDGFIDVSIFYSKVDMTITRAGSTLFEMALWQLPMLVIPIPETISRDQRTNAYAMASRGTAVVIEENNLGKATLLSAIKSIMENKENYAKMSESCIQFENSRTAADVIARELIRIGLSHT